MAFPHFRGGRYATINRARLNFENSSSSLIYVELPSIIDFFDSGKFG